MPRRNCSIFGYSLSWRYAGVSIFLVPKETDNPTKNEWRKNLLNIVTRDRVIDENFRKQINNGDVAICEKHFSEEQMWHCKS